MTTPHATHDGTLELVDGGGFIRFERHLPYTIDDVWAAVTDPARLADWWLPFDADIFVDLRVGGAIVFVGLGDESITLNHTITHLEAPTLLQHTHGDDGSYLRWELTSVDTGCVLRLSHFLSDPDQAGTQPFVVGLHQSLSRLEPALAGRPVPWDWEAFTADQSAYAALGLAPTVDAS